MQESSDALEDLGDTLLGLDPPDQCLCTNVDHEEGKPDQVEPWGSLRMHAQLLLQWILYIAEVPFSLLRVITIPTVDQGWGFKRRIATAVSWPLGVAITVIGFVDYDQVSGTAWGIIVGVSLAIGILFYFTTEDGKNSVVDDGQESFRMSLLDDFKAETSGTAVAANPASPMLLNADRKGCVLLVSSCIDFCILLLYSVDEYHSRRIGR